MPESKNIIEQESKRSRSEISDLIGIPPTWLMRSGISMIALVAFIIIAGSYFFKYPDKLIGSGTLTSTSPPIEIISRSTGYIDDIKYKEGDRVEAGSPILYISNTTDQGQLSELILWVNKYEKINKSSEYLNLPFRFDLQLGAVQSDYAILQLRYNEMQQALKNDVAVQQSNNMTREIEKIRQLNQSKEKEISIFNKELALARKDYQRNIDLNKEEMISDVELERANTTLLQKERELESMNNSIIQNDIRIEQLELEKLKLRQGNSESIESIQYSISEIISRIKASVKTWTNSYVVEAPVSGKVSFLKNVTKQKNIQQGQLLGYIITESKINEQYLSTTMASTNIGKVEIGQKAIIKFDAYPYKEFGVVTSSVASISNIPEINEQGASLYEVKINLEDVIITDYHDTIPNRPNLTALTEIITEEKSVFSRIFDQFNSILK